MSEPVILVGRRADGGHRDRLWQFCASRHRETLGWPIFEGVHDGPGPFCLSVASNRAAALAGDWTVALYVGADWLVADPDQARRAAALAERKGQLVFAHDQTVVLTHDATERLLNGATVPDVLGDGAWHRNTFSGVVAIPRPLWDAVGGFDERYRLWGGEDLSFWAACCALGHGFERVPGVVAHLWHPAPREEREGNPEHEQNVALMRRYLDAKDNEAAMREILAEPGGPLG